MPNEKARWRAARRALAFAPLLAVLGCPLPVAHTTVLSPDVAGRLTREDGAPLAGAPVVLTTSYPRHDVCRGSFARTTTDERGQFSIASVSKRERVVWVVPALDPVAPAYYLCVGAGDTLMIAHVGRGALAPRELPRDSVDCLVWADAKRAHVNCAGRDHAGGDESLVTGGAWAAGGEAGSFRLFVSSDRLSDRGAGVTVQWLAHATSGPPTPVRATVVLPLGPDLVSVRDVRLWAAEGGPCVSVERHWATTWKQGQETLAFQLGAPGEARPIASCTRPSRGD